MQNIRYRGSKMRREELGQKCWMGRGMCVDKTGP